ncbi:DMT family transporter [Gemmobacter fulvus]|uniref:DMT family transporter n=1 Tax=Gemmobacter fulvus TaxID=2840474 RepID=A0A975S105_9RHOB|nr:DMT family transporter [Gemmobacter fulvus]MBT9244952.1 DMT family transporter [Gemmobacter fulvus]MDQ1847817.1 DMT family transporter [Gemmobacter fulvus]QWK90694.1 DMT family transporter [Gemmobacter fulvus]
MTDTKDNLRGILLMVAAMGGFALEDMFIKWAAADLPTGQILVMLGVVGTPVFALMARMEGARAWSRLAWHPAVIWRNLGEMVGTFGFITALALTPLTTATAIFQAAPLAVTLGAALFLGEKVGWRRWSAILLGFVGVLIIIRPGFDGFVLASLWSVLAVIGLSVRDVATRRIPGSITTAQISAWGFFAVALLGAMMLAVTGGAVMPTVAQSGYMAGALFFGISGYWAITQAMRVGEVSVVTPFRYARLVFAMVIGMVVFAERPDAITFAGAALIIGSGLYTFARERMRKRAAARLQA